MTKPQNAKKALIFSTIAFVLSFAMLVGATLAWFTDTVTTKNVINAGKLDVELEYLQNGVWKPVQGKTDLFDPDALWEPGHTEVVYLKLSNLGTLALDYKLLVYAAAETPGTNVYGDPFKLSDYLVFSLIEQNAAGTFATREEIRAAADAAGEFNLGEYPSTAEDVLPAAERYMALVVYMPEMTGNVANYRGDVVPTIDLGIRLDAIQADVENDSFGNDYDENANGNPDHPEFSGTPDTIVTETQQSQVAVNGSTVTATTANAPAASTEGTTVEIAVGAGASIPAGTTLTVTTTTAEEAISKFVVNAGTVSANQTVAAAISLSLSNGATTFGTDGVATVTTYIAAGLTNVSVQYNGEGSQPTLVSYDPATGKLVFKTAHFSEFYAVANDNVCFVNDCAYYDLTDAIEASNGKTITVSGTMVLYASTVSNAVVDLKGATIVGDGNATLVFKNAEGDGAGGTGSFANMTLKNLSVVDETYYIYENGENAWEFTYLEFSGTNTFENVVFTDGVMFEGDLSTCIGCTFIGHNNDSSDLGNVTMYGAWVTNGSATFKNCTFTGTRGLKVSEIYGTDTKTVTVDGCIFDNLSEKPGMAIDIQNNGTADIIIKNSQFINCKPGDQGLYIYETDNLVPTLENNIVADVVINTVEELLTFAANVNTGNSYAGKTIALVADLDLQGVAWTPIGNTTIYAGEHAANDTVFAGSFNGYGHTISNLTVTGEGGNIGFFGKVKFSRESKLENIVFDHATVIGNKAHCVGVLAGSVTADGLKWVSNDGNGGGFDTDNVTNITVKNSTVQGSKYVGGVVGYAQTDIDNVEVINTKVYAVYDAEYQSGASYTDENDSGENAGVVVGDLYSVFSITRAKVTNCTVGGFDKVGGVAGSSRSAHRIANSAVEDLKIEMVTVSGSSKSHYGLITGRADTANGYASRYTGNTASGTATRDSATITVTEYALP